MTVSKPSEFPPSSRGGEVYLVLVYVVFHNPKKETVAIPACGRLNREKRTKESLAANS